MAKEKAELEKKTVSICLNEAVTEIESLRDEMNEWEPKIVDFINGTEKRWLVGEASKSLESGLEAMENWETHTTKLDKLYKGITESELQVPQFKYTCHPYLVRQRRLFNALNCLKATSELFELQKDWTDEAPNLVPSGVGEALGELIEKIDKCKDRVESVYIPGMFT